MLSQIFKMAVLKDLWNLNIPWIGIFNLEDLSSSSVDIQHLCELKAFLSAPNAKGGADAPIWKLTSDGNFNVASIKRVL